MSKVGGTLRGTFLVEFRKPNWRTLTTLIIKARKINKIHWYIYIRLFEIRFDFLFPSS